MISLVRLGVVQSNCLLFLMRTNFEFPEGKNVNT